MKKRDIIKELKIQVYGHTWKVYLITEEQYIEEFGDDSSAITETRADEIYFNPSDITLGTIRHELGHAYLKYHSLDATTMRIDVAEEIFCDFLANQATQTLVQASKLHTSLKKALRSVSKQKNA